MELNRDEVIKALECCYTNNLGCSDCPFQATDKYMECAGLTLSALSLIKQLTEENERLRAEVSVKKKLLDKCVDLEDKAKADTVQKMKERLTTFFNNDDNLKYNEVDAAYINEMIDSIAKEMLENG